MKCKAPGFSFIELIITLFIISVLALLASPTYFQHQQSANREQVKQLLQACMTELSLYHKTAHSYEHIAPQPFPSELQGICNTPHIQTLKHESYQLKVASAGVNSYQLVAQRRGKQQQDTCGDLSIDQNGKKILLNAHASIKECW